MCPVCPSRFTSTLCQARRLDSRTGLAPTFSACHRATLASVQNPNRSRQQMRAWAAANHPLSSSTTFNCSSNCFVCGVFGFEVLGCESFGRSKLADPLLTLHSFGRCVLNKMVCVAGPTSFLLFGTSMLFVLYIPKRSCRKIWCYPLFFHHPCLCPGETVWMSFVFLF